MSEPLQATALGEAVVAMDPLFRGFTVGEKAFASQRGWGFKVSSAREGSRGNGT